jgi:ABC-2 type transport system permease protein
MVLIGAEFGTISLAVGVLTGRRVLAVSVGTVLAVAAYVLYAIGALIEAVEPWQPVSPFYQAMADGPLGAGLPARYLWLAVVSAIAVLVSLPVLDRRDIAAHA